MIRRKPILAASLAGALLLGGMALTAAASGGDDPDAVKAELQAKELAIYSGRAAGQLSNYIDNASPHYLGWPPTAKAPFPLKDLRAGQAEIAGHTQERIETTFTGFTMSGSTAVIYYTNHRTRTRDGAPVDQLFENIHVWTKEDGRWHVLGGLSRMTRG